MLDTSISGVEILGMTSSMPLSKKKSSNNEDTFYSSKKEQTASDLGFNAAQRILNHFNISQEDFGFLLFSSRTPDYRSPITAAVLQLRLDFPIDCICYDVNLGANSFIQMIQLGAAVLQNQNKNFGLLIIGDTPSKLFKESLDSNYEISDAATAIIIRKASQHYQINVSNLTNGSFYNAQILAQGGFRNFDVSNPFDSTDDNNFLVKENNDLFQTMVNESEFDLSNRENDSSIFLHSNLLKFLSVNTLDYLTSTIKADGSELPIALAEQQFVLKDKFKLVFCSIGEGVAIFKMEINHLPFCLKTFHTDDVYLDHHISHFM